MRRSLSAPARIGLRPVLVTGGAGFIGCNLADRLARDGHPVLVLDALARPGVERNLDWLRRTHPGRISVVIEDLRDGDAVSAAVRQAQAVFHLAGQVAVTTSLADPRTDFTVNVEGTLRLLEALRRHNPRAPLVFASTNKVYGDLADIGLERTEDAYRPADADLRGRGIGEDRRLDFHTPYGCSKGAADQYVLDYARSFGLPTAVLRMSCIYGPHQMGTEDQGWVAHFLIRTLAGEPITIFGDGRQVRDILFVDDAVEAYVAAWNRIEAVRGQAFNLGGGPANAVSLLQLIRRIETLTGRSVNVEFRDWRAGDQRYYVSDIGRAHRDLGLPAPLPWREGLRRLADWLRRNPLPADIPFTAHPREQRAEAVP
ncbi:NAD-dependent epimerase/dehydratase family protein [Inquilinus limosus]|uniref:NAD-dependent epimerase/dehydratase family protein n=1 Tax=Inquilinus limosus TaxID=171674 RepID=UPI003F14A110